MAVTGTPARSFRLVPLFLLLVIIFIFPGQSHTSMIPGAATNPSGYEELTASLVVNQLAILHLLQDASNATSAAGEKCRQNEAKLENEVRAQAARLEEALRRLERVEEVVEAGQQRCTQLLEAISTKFITTVQDTTVPPPSPPTSACEEGWVRLDSSCYHINSIAELNWAESRDYCLIRNSDLVKISSGAEDSFIRQQLTDNVWIGLNDRNSEGVFVWTDGSQPGYTAWLNGEPNNDHGKEDCSMLWKKKGYDWNDSSCSNPFGVVCEKSLEPVPS